MIVRSIALDRIPTNVIGIQRVKALQRLQGKPVKLPREAVLNQEELYNRIIEDLEDGLTYATFDTDEEAARIGLMIDARGKGEIGVGIEGTEVFFWRREV